MLDVMTSFRVFNLPANEYLPSQSLGSDSHSVGVKQAAISALADGWAGSFVTNLWFGQL